jgi:hypothetical protein
MKVIPLEEEEQIAFVEWCRLNKIIVHHSGNEIGGSVKALKARAVKMKKMGTSKGFPDLLLFLPVKGKTGRVDAYQPLAIEMKRVKGSTTSPEQREWMTIMEKSGIPAKICKGADEAIKFVEETKKEMEGLCIDF